MVEKLPLTVESMNKMKQIELSEEQTFKLAKQLLETRVEGSKNKFGNEAVKDVLQSQRLEDNGFGLWEVFNRVQENIVNGNFQYMSSKGKIRNARPIKNFKQDLQLNREMFSKAMEYAA